MQGRGHNSAWIRRGGESKVGQKKGKTDVIDRLCVPMGSNGGRAEDSALPGEGWKDSR